MAIKSRPAIVKIENLKGLKDEILAKVTASSLYVKKLKPFLDDRMFDVEITAENHYNRTLEVIEDSLKDGAARGSMGHSSIETIEGRVTLKPGWRPLSKSWLKDKKRRSKPGYTPNKNMRRGKAMGSPGRVRGRSFGADRHWLDEKKFYNAFKSSVLGRGKVDVEYTMKEMRDGTYAVEYRLVLGNLPAGYLNQAIRRSLILGAEGAGSGGLVDLPKSMLTKSRNPRGLARGGWPEYHQPLMRPIAQRLGRAMKQQILKSLARR